MGFAKRLLPYAVGYGLVMMLLVGLTSPVVATSLGKSFTPVTVALRWLSPLILFKSIHYFLADALTGAGFQGLRAAVQVGVAVMNVLLNLWLMPTYSWRGAAWASLACDGFLAIALWVIAGILMRCDGLGIQRSEFVPAVIPPEDTGLI